MNSTLKKEAKEYFTSNDSVYKRRYNALNDYIVNDMSAEEVAKKYGYKTSSIYSLSRDFYKFLENRKDNEENSEDFFFKDVVVGRKSCKTNELKELVIKLRKQNHSVEEIVGVANAKSLKTSYWPVYNILRQEGFARLFRRSKEEKKQLETNVIKAPVAEKLDFEPEKFFSSNTGLFAFLPIIHKYGIYKLIENSTYPFTKCIGKMSSILCFLALKLSGIMRYSHDDSWCMDRGMGLFAGLTVLPKTSWFSAYSSRVEPQMNVSFLKELHQLWYNNSLLSDTVNLDFTTIPYWGDDAHLENNWSGKRGKALSSMLAVFAQDPDSGIIDYANCDVMHKNESAVVLEYLDFYRSAPGCEKNLKYMIFDSKFTNYQNLAKLDDDNIKFITIRRRGGKMLEEIRKIKSNEWKKVQVESSSGLNRKNTLMVYSEDITLPGYKDEKTGKNKIIRQIIITGHGKPKPAIMLTNEFDLKVETIVRKYRRRWIVEKGISEQIEFFHLNRVSSSMVIKVDFDMVMTILAHNLYRLLALEFDRYKHVYDEKIYRKFVENSGSIDIQDDSIRIDLKKKRELPQLLAFLKKSSDVTYPWLNGKNIVFNATASS